ncbi:MAG: hypothetical protein ACK5IJ_05915 [Mangrovibacterium sp.]
MNIKDIKALTMVLACSLLMIGCNKDEEPSMNYSDVYHYISKNDEGTLQYQLYARTFVYDGDVERVTLSNVLGTEYSMNDEQYPGVQYEVLLPAQTSSYITGDYTIEVLLKDNTTMTNSESVDYNGIEPIEILTCAYVDDKITCDFVLDENANGYEFYIKNNQDKVLYSAVFIGDSSELEPNSENVVTLSIEEGKLATDYYLSVGEELKFQINGIDYKQVNLNTGLVNCNALATSQQTFIVGNVE